MAKRRVIQRQREIQIGQRDPVTGRFRARRTEGRKVTRKLTTGQIGLFAGRPSKYAARGVSGRNKARQGNVLAGLPPRTRGARGSRSRGQLDSGGAPSGGGGSVAAPSPPAAPAGGGGVSSGGSVSKKAAKKAAKNAARAARGEMGSRSRGEADSGGAAAGD